jgi:hypothetical protein
MSKERASSPDTHPEDLRMLAWSYPKEVLRNPLLPMISLESPELYHKILIEACRGLGDVELYNATPEQRQRLSQQIKQKILTLTTELQLVKDGEYHQLWCVALQKTIEYHSFEDSFAELFCLSILGSSQMYFTTPDRSVDMYLFETRSIGEEKVAQPYYVIECWTEHENPGDVYVEVEHVLYAACAWLFDDISFEALRDTYLSQALTLDRLSAK